MNLNTITEVKRPSSADQITQWRDNYAWLAGGTWLFSEPQFATDTLIDLDHLKWPALRASAVVLYGSRLSPADTFLLLWQPRQNWMNIGRTVSAKTSLAGAGAAAAGGAAFTTVWADGRKTTHATTTVARTTGRAA